MAINVELRKSDSTTYAGSDNLIYLKTSVGLIDGLLDDNDKIAPQWLPGYVLGGMRFVQHINETISLADIHNLADTYVSTNGGSVRGCYFIIPANPVEINIPHEYIVFGDEGSGVITGAAYIVLEVGDWLICVDDNGKKWAVLNNTYQDATTVVKGIVKLATEQNGIDGTLATVAMTPKATVAAINARAYSHPTHTAKNETFSAVETLSALSVNSLGHVTSFAKQEIRVASEAQTGVIRLASSSEAKAATDDTKATSPLRVKEMIDKFASIPIVQNLPTDMSDHPAGKLIMLQL